MNAALTSAIRACSAGGMPQGELVRLEDGQTTAYSEFVMGTVRYTTDGPLRGRCGHQHKSLEGAIKCLDDDETWCRELGGGGHTDRRIFVVGNRQKRELNAEELAAVELYRRTMEKGAP